jgi:hypothetical protein
VAQGIGIGKKVFFMAGDEEKEDIGEPMKL